jgi:MinD-like ATPase involved in chromosome partitioning or flagellar assembly
MKIAIYNDKGGQGKTFIAANLALSLKFAVISNEPHRRTLDKILPEGAVVKLSADEQFPQISKNANVIFDFGGFLDSRVGDALDSADVVLVPVINELEEVQAAVDCIGNIEEFNRNIVIIANKATPADLEDIKTIMGQFYPDYPVLQLRNSRFIPKIAELKIPVQAMVSLEGLNARHHAKEPAAQFKTILEVISQLPRPKGRSL